jgi:hypothetical protein
MKEKARKEKEREEDKGMEEEREERVREQKGAPPSSTTKEIAAGFFKAFVTNAASSLSSAHLNTSASNCFHFVDSGHDATNASSTSTSKYLPALLQLPSHVKPNFFEQFTFKPSSTETDLPNPPPRFPPEI